MSFPPFQSSLCHGTTFLWWSAVRRANKGLIQHMALKRHNQWHRFIQYELCLEAQIWLYHIFFLNLLFCQFEPLKCSWFVWFKTDLRWDSHTTLHHYSLSPNLSLTQIRQQISTLRTFCFDIKNPFQIIN